MADLILRAGGRPLSANPPAARNCSVDSQASLANTDDLHAGLLASYTQPIPACVGCPPGCRPFPMQSELLARLSALHPEPVGRSDCQGHDDRFFFNKALTLLYASAHHIDRGNVYSYLRLRAGHSQ